MKNINRKLLLIVPVALFLFVIKDHLGFVPMWDGGYYFNCVIDVTSTPLLISKYNCSNHPSYLYTFILSLGQYLDKGNVLYLHLTNIILFVLSIFFFYRIITLVSGGRADNFDQFLITGVYAVYPIFMANLINVSPDIGVLVFSVLVLYFLLNKRLVLSSLLGLFLVLSKESGLVIYIYMVGFYLLFFEADFKNVLGSLKFKTRQFIILFIPLIAFIGHGVLIKTGFNNTPPVITFGFLEGLVNIANFSLKSKSYQANFILALILEFNWILALTVVLGLAISGGRFLLTLGGCLGKGWPSLRLRRCLFLFTVSLATLLTVTLYKTYTNARYYMFLYPFLFILFYLLLPVVISNRFIRRVVLTAYFLLVMASNYRTIDPVSKFIFTTFKFGNHEILKMTSFTGEYAGYGRDQLIYNLQYTNLQYITSEIFRTLKPAEDNLFLINGQADWNFIDVLDSKTDWMTTKEFLTSSQRPKTVYFIEYPNFDNTADMAELSFVYDISNVFRFGRGGYFIRVYEMRLKV